MKDIRTGVYICMCGTNIARIVDVEAVASFVSGLPNVVLARTYKYMCSNPGQEMIVQDIKENQLTEWLWQPAVQICMNGLFVMP